MNAPLFQSPVAVPEQRFESKDMAEDLSLADLEERLLHLDSEEANRFHHQCEQYLELRKRTVAKGGQHAVYQCLRCGEQRGGSVSKKNAPEVLPLFDSALGDLVRAEYRDLTDRRTVLNDQIVALTNPVRAAEVTLQQKLVQDAECQATQALDAALDHLVSVKSPANRLQFVMRHLKQRASDFSEPENPSVQFFQSENELKLWLDGWIERDFDVWREVSGQHLTEGVGVKLDYIIVPKKHLSDAGFKAAPIGIEVKYLPLVEGFAPKASHFVWQAVSYTDCEFDLEGQPTRLRHVLLFSNLSFHHELRELKFLGSAKSSDRSKWDALIELANHANVGQFEVNGTPEIWSGWKISFAGGTYFSKHAKYGCKLHNKNLLEKVRIGNF